MEKDLTKKYSVYIDSNYPHEIGEFHVYDSFDTHKEAMNLCEQIINKDLRDTYTLGMNADELMGTWALFGSDPWISGSKDDVRFCSHDYVTEEKCQEIINEIKKDFNWWKKIKNFILSIRIRKDEGIFKKPFKNYYLSRFYSGIKRLLQ